MSTPKVVSRKPFVALGLAALLALAPAVAEAKAGSGSSLGSRGTRTFSAPPTTRTAPGTASQFQRSTTPQPAPGLNRPATAAPAQQSRGMFGSFGKGLLGGLLGAGLIGMLMGNGFLGGLGGLMSMMGLLLQVALIGFLALLAFRWWTNRNQPQQAAMAGATPYGAPRTGFGGEEPRNAGGFGFGGGAPAQPVETRPLTLQEADFNAFERKLGEVQQAYSDEDTDHLRRIATEEMVGYFSDDFVENRGKGVISKSSGTRLLNGDLSEAWTEGREDYATVAMHFSLVDVLQDRATGRVVSGDPSQPVENTELWTFVRPAGSGPEAWKLSGIQQTQ
jgi:predicted lipid-binding transport protein (Tim44 family)